MILLALTVTTTPKNVQRAVLVERDAVTTETVIVQQIATLVLTLHAAYLVVKSAIIAHNVTDLSLVVVSAPTVSVAQELSVVLAVYTTEIAQLHAATVTKVFAAVSYVTPLVR